MKRVTKYSEMSIQEQQEKQPFQVIFIRKNGKLFRIIKEYSNMHWYNILTSIVSKKTIIYSKNVY